MNEDHIIAALLTAGMIASDKDKAIQPKAAISLYETTLAELIASNRPPRESGTD